jgi:hypothetical protein
MPIAKIITFIIRNSRSWSKLAISLIVSDCKLLFPITVLIISFIFFNTILIKTPLIMYSIRAVSKHPCLRMFEYCSKSNDTKRHFIFGSALIVYTIHVISKKHLQIENALFTPPALALEAYDIKSC